MLVRQPSEAPGWTVRLQDALFIGLMTSRWILGNVLASLGVLTAASFLLTGASLHGFLLHLHNLSARYVAADSVRQSEFAGLLGLCVVVLFGTASLLRLSRLGALLGRTRRRVSGGGA